MTELVPTPDGRVLEVLVSGPEDGFPFVVHHGTPTGAVPDPKIEEPAAARGLRTIAYSRPGYGRSSPRPDGAATATVADDAADVVAILDHLGLGEVRDVGLVRRRPAVAGLRRAAPGRCRGAVCGVGLVPPEEYDGDVRTGMGEENVEEFTAAMDGEPALTAWLEKHSPALFSVTPDEIADALGSLAPPVDRGRPRPGTWPSGPRPGSGTPATRGSWAGCTTTWRWSGRGGSTSATSRCPSRSAAGTEDTMVPFAHAEWLAGHVPGARRHLEEGEGHISLRAQVPRILDDLLDLAELPSR